MSLRMKVHLLLFVAFPVGAFGLSLLGIIHPALAFLAFPYVVLVSLLSSRVRCPNCGVPVEWQTYRILEYRVRMRSAYIRRLCDQCSYDLSTAKARPEEDD
jgi:hypothetical protein